MSAAPAEAKNAIDSMREQHHKMVDWVLVNFKGPGDLQRMADELGYSYSWCSQVMNSDMFKAELARRRAGVNDLLATTVVSQTFANANKAAELLGDYLATLDAHDDDFDPRLVLDINDRTMRQLGYAPNKSVTLNLDQSVHNTQLVVEENLAAAARERMMNRARQGTTVDGEVSPS